ncbi:MAG: hypothetical protein AB7U29_16205 [Desulfobulbus sp.]
MLRKISLAFGLSVLINPCVTLGQYTSGVEHVDNRGAAFLASPFFAAFDPAPQTPRPPIYRYPIPPPPGKCRWERQLLAPNGTPLLDQSGQPVREYITGPCGRPPY